MVEVWKIFEKYLKKVESDFRLEVMNFVLMSNHFHMIVFTPEANLDSALHYLLREVSKKIGIRSGRVNHLFGTPYKWTIIDTAEYLSMAYKYIYRNPIASGQVTNAEKYPFSTLYWLNQGKNLKFSIYDKIDLSSGYIPKHLEERITWINTPYPNELIKKIHTAMKHRRFRLPQRVRK